MDRQTFINLKLRAMKHFRARRMEQMAEIFGLDDSTRVVDVGGYERNWTLIEQQPTVVLVNLEDESWTRGRFSKVKGDGCRLEFADNSFDLAYSNSVIEHVGDAQRQADFAGEIRRVAPRYYVQTPNKWFFLEPHLVAPFIHYLPPRLSRKLVRRASVWGWVEKPDQQEIDEFLADIQLLDLATMRNLFPDAEIIEERFLGMTKSIIAVRRQPPT